MMQNLGRYAIKNILFRRKTPSIRFSGTLTSPELNDTLHSQVMARGRDRWKVTSPLDEWLKQGTEINPTELRGLINALCECQRFDHALQVSEWITKQGVFNLSPEDFASRLYLVEIRSGLKEADKFFKNIPENMRDDSVYNTLLTLYTKSKNTRHEAEAIYQKMREQNMLSKPNPYYNMIALYGFLGARNMVDEIVRQMEENGVEHDVILTANNVLKAYASISDVEVMEKFMMGLEVEEPRFVLTWQTGISVAKAYLKSGSSKKAIEMLRRTELVVDAKSKDAANKVLMEMYDDAGAKLDKFRLNRLMYQNSKKGKIKRTHNNVGDGGGYSHYPIYYYTDSGSRRGRVDGNGDGDGDGGGGSGDGGGDGGGSGDDGGDGGGGCGGDCGGWD